MEHFPPQGLVSFPGVRRVSARWGGRGGAKGGGGRTHGGVETETEVEAGQWNGGEGGGGPVRRRG